MANPRRGVLQSAMPCYVQIAATLRQRILDGTYPPESALPSEHELSAQFKASRPTVRHALEVLADEGLIRRVAGLGTFVAAPAPVRGGNTVGNIAFVVGDLRDLFVMHLAAGAERCAAERGYHIIFCNAGNRVAAEAAYLRDMWQQHKADGFLVMAADSLEPHRTFRELVLEGVPIVLIDRYFADLAVDYVVSDNLQGGYLATQHLLQLGARRIGFVTRPNLYISSAGQRLQGYKKALAEAGMAYDSSLIFQGLLPHLPESHMMRDETSRGFEFDLAALREFLQRQDRPDAVFCCNDLIAVEVLQACESLGLRVPQDVAVVGFDDDDYAAWVRPALTTVRQRLTEMGRAGAELLLDRVEGRRRTVEPVILPVELVVRESSGQGISLC